MMQVFKLLTIVIFIITGVQPEILIKDVKLQNMQEGFKRFERRRAERLFPKLEKSPIIVSDKNNMIIAIVTIPYVKEQISSVIINVDLIQFQKSCSFRPKWLKTEIIDYQAVIQENGRIVVSLKLQLIPTFKYHWDFILLDPVTCEPTSKPFKNSYNISSLNYFVKSMFLVPKKNSFNIFAELSTVLTDQKNRLAMITFNNYNKKDKTEQKRKRRKNIGYFNLKPVANETIRFDENNKLYYVIQKIGKSTSKFWPVRYGRSFKFGYEFYHEENIDTADKAISVDNGHVTICYKEIIRIKTITCKMFNIETAEEFNTVSIPVNQTQQGIIVKNIDEKYTLIMWIENLNGQGSNVMAQIIGPDKSMMTKKVFHTNDKIDYINYNQAETSHCLYIVQSTDFNAAVYSFCFIVSYNDLNFFNELP